MNERRTLALHKVNTWMPESQGDVSLKMVKLLVHSITGYSDNDRKQYGLSPWLRGKGGGH